jgi:hypothetical protein
MKTVAHLLINKDYSNKEEFVVPAVLMPELNT